MHKKAGQWQACLSWFPAPLPGVELSVTYSGLGPSTAMINQEDAPQTYLHNNLMEIFPIEIPSSRVALVCVRLTKTTSDKFPRGGTSEFTRCLLQFPYVFMEINDCLLFYVGWCWTTCTSYGQEVNNNDEYRNIDSWEIHKRLCVWGGRLCRHSWNVELVILWANCTEIFNVQIPCRCHLGSTHCLHTLRFGLGSSPT